MSGGRTSPQSGFDSERYGELYKALVQDIVEVCSLSFLLGCEA